MLEVIALRVGPAPVDDREVSVGEAAGHRPDGLGYQEADTDHEVVATGGVVGQVGDVIRVDMGLSDVTLDTELTFAAKAGTDIAGRRRLAETQRSQVVEALVVHATRIRNQTDLDGLHWCGPGGSGAAAGRQEDRQRHAY